jgi:hypothetical protein
MFLLSIAGNRAGIPWHGVTMAWRKRGVAPAKVNMVTQCWHNRRNGTKTWQSHSARASRSMYGGAPVNGYSVLQRRERSAIA